MSLPIAVASTVWLSENVTRMSVAASTTCALVRISPSWSITKPEPVDSDCCVPEATSNGDASVRSVRAATNTTPGERRR